MYSTAHNLWTFTWFVHFELPFRLKGTEKIHTQRFFKFPSNIYSILYACNISTINIMLSVCIFQFFFWQNHFKIINSWINGSWVFCKENKRMQYLPQGYCKRVSYKSWKDDIASFLSVSLINLWAGRSK